MFWKWPKVNAQISMFDWISNGIPLQLFVSLLALFSALVCDQLNPYRSSFLPLSINLLHFNYFNGMQEKTNRFTLSKLKTKQAYCIFADIFMWKSGALVYTNDWFDGDTFFRCSHFSFICMVFRDECNMWARTRTMHINYVVWIELHISSYMHHFDECILCGSRT